MALPLPSTTPSRAAASTPRSPSASRPRAPDFRGPDPFDGLWWHWPRALVGGRRRRQAIAQLHARSPFDVRRLYRRRHPRDRQGARGLRLGRGARAAARRTPLRLATPDCAPSAPRRRPRRRTATAGATRGTCRRAGASIRRAARTSSSPPSRRAGCSRAPPTLGRGRPRRPRARGRALGPRRALDRARGLLRLSPGPAREHPQRQPARRVAGRRRRWRRIRPPESASRAPCERTLDAQRPDGSWPYGEGRNLAWADSFHTGYVLLCLDRLRAVDGRVGEAVQRGAAHYRGFFDAAGRARLWAGQAVSRGRALGRHRPERPGRPRAPRAGRARAARARGAARPRSRPARRPRRAPALPLGRARPCATCAGATRTSRSGSSTPPRRCAAWTTSRRRVQAAPSRRFELARRSRRARSAPRSPNRSGRPGERR